MRRSTFTAAVFLAAAAALPAAAQDAYVIGLTGAITGPAAGTNGPAVEGLRAYINRLNETGGVNGKQVRLVLQDDQGEPSKAAANAKKLLTQDNVALLINASLSSTYAPVIAETKRAQVPLLFMGAVCPKDVYPPAEPLLFCSTAFASNFDGRAAMAFVKETAKESVRLGLAAMAIPISRAEIDFVEEHSKSLGITPVDKEIIPPPTADYTPFATKLKDANANWVFSWAPWVTQVRTFEALRRLGWQGDYLAWGHIEAEGELLRLKDPKFYVIGATALFSENLPVHKEIADAAKKANATYPAELVAEGWIGGLVVEAALKATGWPASPAKIQTAMLNLKIDTKGLRGGPIEWTKDNHFRTRQSYRIYRWDPGRGAVVRVKDWFAYDVK
jgi:branched-chain amino acid transport system substrate-binding protein